MRYSIETLLNKVNLTPDTVEFSEVMQVITDNYQYTPTRFSNGDLINEAGTNEGSCKLFAFAKLQTLSEAQTLACFGTYYRDDVLKNPQGIDHNNIRNFISLGWTGVLAEHLALVPKT